MAEGSSNAAHYAGTIPNLVKLVADGTAKPAQRVDGILALLAVALIGSSDQASQSLLADQVGFACTPVGTVAHDQAPCKAQLQSRRWSVQSSVNRMRCSMCHCSAPAHQAAGLSAGVACSGQAGERAALALESQSTVGR